MVEAMRWIRTRTIASRAERAYMSLDVARGKV